MIHAFMTVKKNGPADSLLPVSRKEPESGPGTGFDRILQRELSRPAENTGAAETRIDRPDERDNPVANERKAENNPHKAETPVSEKPAAEDKKTTGEQGVKEHKTSPEEEKKIQGEGSLIDLKPALKGLPESVPADIPAESLQKKQAPLEEKLQAIEEITAALLQKDDILPRELKGLLEKTEELVAKIEDGALAQKGKKLLGKLRSLMEKTSPGEEIKLPLVKETLKELAGLVREQAKPAAKNRPSTDNRAAVLPDNAVITEKSGTATSAFQMNDFTSEHGNDSSRDNPANSFLNNSIKAASLKGNNTASASTTKGSFQQQFNEIIENARVVVRDSRNGAFSMRLNPRQLGSVTVNLGLEQGILNGRFLVENNEARNLLLENLDAVREHLEEAGIDIGEFQVNVRDQHQAPRDQEDMPAFALQGGTMMKEEQASYDISAATVHDGAINVII